MRRELYNYLRVQLDCCTCDRLAWRI